MIPVFRFERPVLHLSLIRSPWKHTNGKNINKLGVNRFFKYLMQYVCKIGLGFEVVECLPQTEREGE